MKQSTVQVDVWSDYVCPFCYLAEPTLTKVKQEFGDEVRITWRAFELRPRAAPFDGSWV